MENITDTQNVLKDISEASDISEQTKLPTDSIEKEVYFTDFILNISGKFGNYTVGLLDKSSKNIIDSRTYTPNDYTGLEKLALKYSKVFTDDDKVKLLRIFTDLHAEITQHEKSAMLNYASVEVKLVNEGLFNPDELELLYGKLDAIDKNDTSGILHIEPQERAVYINFYDTVVTADTIKCFRRVVGKLQDSTATTEITDNRVYKSRYNLRVALHA